MSDSKNENCIVLKFLDFKFPPHVITEQLMLTPAITALQGEKREKTMLLWKSNLWIYEERSTTNKYIADQVEEFVIRVVTPISEKIRKILEDCYGELSIAQYYYDGCNPGYHFSRKTLSIINETGLEIDIDTYCLGNVEK